MESLKKISKNYLSLSFSMLLTMVMALGVGSCECGKGGDTGNPSISFKKDTLIGNEKTTELVVGGAYMPGDFEIKVAVTNGSIKIHGHKLIDGDKKLLNEVLGSEDKVEEGKDLTVEVEPTDVTLAFEATVTILKKENGEAVNNAKINWNPGVTTGFEGKISDLVGDKVTVEIKLKEDGKEVAVEAGDVQDIEVIVVSNQNKPGESAMIAGLDANGKVKLQAGDIKAGILTKELQVTPGTKDTELTITVTSKGNEITGAKKKITVLAAATYTFEFNPKKIEDGATTVQVVLKKGNKDLVKVEVDKLKFKVVKRDKGTAATIAGKDPGQKIDLNVTLVNANKEATMNLVIDPKTDKSVTWELELEDENAVAIPRTKQTLEWENGIDLDMESFHDRTGNKVKITVKNKGKAEVQDLELSFNRTVGVAAVLNTKDTEVVAILANTTKVSSTSPFSVDLPIDLKTDANATFKFTLKHKGANAVDKSFTYTAVAPTVTISAAKTDYKGNAEKQVTITIKAGAIDDLTAADLQAVTLVYTSPKGGELTKGGANVHGKNLETVFGISGLTKNTTKDVVVDIDNKAKGHVTFTDIKLQGSKDEATNKIAKVEWQGEFKVALAAVKKGNNQVTVSFTNNSGFDLTEVMLKKITFEYTKGNTAFLKGGTVKTNTHNKTLWDLVGKAIPNTTTEAVDLDVDLQAELDTQFTNLKLVGSADATVQENGPIKFAQELKVALAAVKKGNNQVTVSFTNNSGFDLTEVMLKKITFEYIKGNTAFLKGGTVKTNAHNKTLWDLVGKAIPNTTTEAVDLDVDLQAELDTQFTNLKLVGSADATVQENGPIKFVKELKVALAAVKKGNNQVTVSFTNNSGFDLTEVMLKKITFEYTKGNTAFLKGGTVKTNAHNKTLWDLVGKAIPNTTTEAVDLDVDLQAELDTQFTNLKLVGSADATVQENGPIKFAQELKVALAAVKKGIDKLTVSFTNNSGFELTEVMLKKITFEYTKGNTAFLKGGTVKTNTHNKTLWDLVGKAIPNTTTEAVDLDVDLQAELDTQFTNLKLVGSADATVQENGPIKFAQELKVALAAVKKGNNQVTVSFTNNSGFDLTEVMLKKITFEYIKGNTAFLKGGTVKTNAHNKTLWDLVGKAIPNTTTEAVDLDVDLQAELDTQFTNLKLVGSADATVQENGPIKFVKELKVALAAVKKGIDKLTVSFTNNSGFELTEVMLKKITFEYIKGNTAFLKGGKVKTNAHNKNLWALVGKTIPDTTTEAIDLDVDLKAEFDTQFTDLKLVGSADATVQENGPIKFVKELKVALGAVKKGANQVTVSFTNNSGFELTEVMLKKIAFQYTTNNTAILEGGKVKTNARDKTLWDLVGKAIGDTLKEDVDLDLNLDTEVGVNFTNFNLIGSADPKAVVAAPINF